MSRSSFVSVANVFCKNNSASSVAAWQPVFIGVLGSPDPGIANYADVCESTDVMDTVHCHIRMMGPHPPGAAPPG